MEATLHRFVRLLRLGGLRVSIPEALDAMRCAGQPGVLSSRAVLRTALRVALVKDQRDEPMFDEIFDAFFALVRVGDNDAGHGHSHAHDDLLDTGELESFTLSEETGARREIVQIAADPATNAQKTTTTPIVPVSAMAAAAPPTRPAAGRVSNHP